VIRVLVENRWPWRLHATYDETITRALDVYERVNRDQPFGDLHWFFDHAETISERNIDRDRRARRRHRRPAPHGVPGRGLRRPLRRRRPPRRTPPIKRMLDAGVRFGAGIRTRRVSRATTSVGLA
jgi:predicted amidohydrolase YtcJ